MGLLQLEFLEGKTCWMKGKGLLLVAFYKFFKWLKSVQPDHELTRLVNSDRRLRSKMAALSIRYLLRMVIT
jgi:hypothetical protein